MSTTVAYARPGLILVYSQIVSENVAIKPLSIKYEPSVSFVPKIIFREMKPEKNSTWRISAVFTDERTLKLDGLGSSSGFDLGKIGGRL